MKKTNGKWNTESHVWLFRTIKDVFGTVDEWEDVSNLPENIWDNLHEAYKRRFPELPAPSATGIRLRVMWSVQEHDGPKRDCPVGGLIAREVGLIKAEWKRAA